jgi:hypothetical protein
MCAKLGHNGLTKRLDQDEARVDVGCKTRVVGVLFGLR